MNENGANDPKSLASAIHEHFRMLVETLATQIEQVDDPESELLAALWKAKLVAERGVRLSECLAERLGNAASG